MAISKKKSICAQQNIFECVVLHFSIESAVDSIVGTVGTVYTFMRSSCCMNLKVASLLLHLESFGRKSESLAETIFRRAPFANIIFLISEIDFIQIWNAIRKKT